MARSSSLPKWVKHSASHLSLTIRGRTVHLTRSKGLWRPELDNGQVYRDAHSSIKRAKFAAVTWLSMTLSVTSDEKVS
jgi:hypothetical protein